jgi:Metallo-beta-lactamase superfamily
MKQIADDLWQSTKHQTGILTTHAYLLVRPEGNILFYNTGNTDDLEKISKLGGVKYQLLTHRDEAGPSLARIKTLFNSALGCSALEKPFVEKEAPVDLVFLAGGQMLEDVEVIETPGHSNGSVCFAYNSPHGKSYLFTGDTIFQSNGAWGTFVITSYGGTNEGLINSLNRLRDFSPDIVMSSGSVGELSQMEMTRDRWIKAIDEKITELTS